MRNKTGGPAFPTPRFTMDGEGRVMGFSISTDGMSLRDYFAGQAMHVVYAKHWEMFMDETYDGPDEVQTGTAQEAYALADAMLKAREE